MQNIQVEHSRGYSSLVEPVAIATADGASVVTPTILRLVEDDAPNIELVEDHHREAVAATFDRPTGTSEDLEQQGYDDSDYWLPAKVSSMRAARLEGLYTYGPSRGYKSRSHSRDKFRRRALERRLSLCGWRLVAS